MTRKGKGQPVTHAKSVVKRQSIAWRTLMTWMAISLCTGLLVWAYTVATNPLTFPVNTVKIIGEYDKIDKQALIASIKPQVSQGFFNVDVGSIKQQVEAMPWVAHSIVEKVWPDKLLVQLEQHRPVGRWNDKALFTAKRQIFYPPKHSLHAYPLRLNGPEGNFDEVLQDYGVMAAALHPLGLNITEITLEPRQAWRLRLNNGMQLILGKNNYHERLARFIRAYPKVFNGRGSEVEYIDLRYASGMAVRWKSPLDNLGTL